MMELFLVLGLVFAISAITGRDNYLNQKLSQETHREGENHRTAFWLYTQYLWEIERHTRPPNRARQRELEKIARYNWDRKFEEGRNRGRGTS